MKKIYLFILCIFLFGALYAQNTGYDTSSSFADVKQINAANDAFVHQESLGKQSAWVLQVSGDEVSEGRANIVQVDQYSTGMSENKTFVYQLGSGDQAIQYQNGKGNEFNITENFTMDLTGISDDENFDAPNQDGDYHYFEQRATGNFNKASFFQAGRDHDGSQTITGDKNEMLTIQNGNSNTSSITVTGDRNGSHYMVHGEGKFPHDEDEESDNSDAGPSHGNGQGGNSSQGDGGSPSQIPPPHDDDHEFVPSVSVAIMQMGKSSYATITIDGDDNKAQIIQRGGACAEDSGSDNGQGNSLAEAYNHEAMQEINGSWNRIFADQRGTNHYSNQNINGYFNLNTNMQKGNGSTTTVDIDGHCNEIGTDQKGKGNFSDIDITGNFNGNLFLCVDDYGVKVTQEGKGNWSDLDIVGNFNTASIYQNGGGISTVDINGNFNTSIVSQSSEDEH